jgi:hypothetical protein
MATRRSLSSLAPAIVRGDGMRRLELILVHSASAAGYNVRRLFEAKPSKTERSQSRPRNEDAARRYRSAIPRFCVLRLLRAKFHAKASACSTSCSNPGGGPDSCPRCDLGGLLAETPETCLEILSDELGLSARPARNLVINSVSSAHACVQAINRRATMIAEYETRVKCTAR